MPWQIFIALRYLTSKRKEKFISIISGLSIVGVSLGVAALIIVISVMSGFDADLEEKIVGTNAHIEILSDYGMKPPDFILSKVLATPHVQAASFFLNGQALIRSGENVTGILVRGVDPAGEVRVNEVQHYIKEGSLDLGQDGVVIGSELASRLKRKIGDRLSVISPAYIEGKDFRIRGIFSSGMYEYDSNLVYMDIARAQDLFGTQGMAGGLGVRVDDAFKVEEVKRALQKELGFPYIVRSWMDANKNLLAALKLEKTVMFLILTLIIMVACFNIASSLIMTVLEKTKDIGILKAIGATKTSVMAIFAIQGGIIGVLGTAMGASLGVIICKLLKTYKFITLPKDIYYIDKLPVKMEMNEIIIIVAASVVLSFIATLYPAYKAARFDPVEALRYE